MFEMAIDSVIMETYIQCVATRNVMNIVENPDMENILASFMSILASKLDSKAGELLNRPIKLCMKFIYIDAPYFKVHEKEKYRRKALYVYIGINPE